MQPTFLPPPTNPPQGNNFMNFPNGGVSNQQGPPGTDPSLSNQFANIDLNNSGSNNHSYGSHPSTMAPLPVDPMKFSNIAPPSGNFQYSSAPVSKPPSNPFPPPSSVPTSFLSNASAPSPLPSNLLGNHQNNQSHPPQHLGNTPNNANYGLTSGPPNQFTQQGPPTQSNQNEHPQSKPPGQGTPGNDFQRKSASPQQPPRADPGLVNRLNSPANHAGQAPSALSRPPQSNTPGFNSQQPDGSSNLQSPDGTRSSAFKPSGAGPFQPLKPSQNAPFSTSQQSFPSQLGGETPSARPLVSQGDFTPAIGAFPAPSGGRPQDNPLFSPQSPPQQSFGPPKTDSFPPQSSAHPSFGSVGAGDSQPQPSPGASFNAPPTSLPSGFPPSNGALPNQGFAPPGVQSPLQPPRQQQDPTFPPTGGINGYPSSPPSSLRGPPSGVPPMNGPSGGLTSHPLGGPPMNGPAGSLSSPPLGGPPLNGPGPGGRPNLSRPHYARPSPQGYPPQPASQQGGPAGFPPGGEGQSFPPSQPGGFPPQQSPQGSFPPQQQQPGYPSQQQPGFPSQQQPGFPPMPQSQSAGGFPQKFPPQSPPGFPPQPGPTVGQQFPPGGGYPGQQPSGYPQSPGYQPQQAQEYSGMQYPNNRPQPPTQKKLDADNMPSRIQVMEDDRKSRSGEFRTDQRGALPPLVTTPFTVTDQGNCSPRFVRTTMYSVPTTADIMKQVSVPFGLVISPMARVAEGEMELPEADFSQAGGPVRCGRCKAYMAPFMQFVDGGRRFQCPMCKATSDVPETYFAHMDALGQRMDKYQRPELCLGSYEMIVSEQYCRDSKFPAPPALIFVLDVSYSNVKSGLVQLLCARMMDILSNVTNERLRVGFITYASSVHFYNIKASLVKPELLEVTDVSEMFMPLLDGFLGTVQEAGTAIDRLMSELPALFQDTRETETLLLPAIQAGLEALKANDTTGKLLVFNSSLPIFGAPGKLANRDDRKMLGTDKEKSVLVPQNTQYNNLAQECVNSGVSVDMFVFNNAYVDLATIGQVPRLTGGQIFKYTYFQAGADGERLIDDVRRTVTRPTAYDAVMRVRTSTGIRPTDFYGHMYMSNTTDMEFASLDSDKAVALELKHDDKLVPEEGVIIQVAFLYTSAYGVRKVRVHNLSLNCTAQMADIYRYCELDTLMNFLAKQCAAKIADTTPRALREALVTKTATILATYRKHCASPGSSLGQLILPECLKLLPLYANSLLRCDALSGGPEISLDDRSFALYSASVMDIPTSVVYLYPHLISLHNLDPASDELPIQERCSFEKLSPEGAYLLDNSVYMFLWLGQAVSPHWVEAVFGVPSPAHIDTDRLQLPELNNPLNRRVHDVIETIRGSRPRSLRLTVIRQKDKLEVVLRQFLIEDRGHTEAQMSYVDFLCHIHKEIRNQLS